jgi:hypothetical protein
MAARKVGRETPRSSLSVRSDGNTSPGCRDMISSRSRSRTSARFTPPAYHQYLTSHLAV